MMKPPPGLDIEIVEMNGQTFLVLRWPKAKDARPVALTAAEAAVLQAIRRGASNEQIARERGTSARTIANQVQSLFRKLGVSSRHQLVAKTS